jgi:anti-sigma B factor antagonist
MAIAEERMRGVQFGLERVVSDSKHTLVLSGELDMPAAAELQPVILSCVRSKPSLTLDLRQLTFMDSSGVHLVLFAQKLCEDKGAEFVLIPGPRQVQRVFEITGVLNRLPWGEETT